MSNSVGQINLDLNVNSSKFKSQMNGLGKLANKESGKISGALGKIGKAAAVAFSVKKIVDFSKECIKLGSDLAEVQNVVDVTFGSMSSAVNKWAKDAMTQFGLSEKVAKEYMGTFGAMSKAFGNTEAMAYDQAKALTGLAGDVASFYNLTTDEAFTKLKAVYTGETEGLKSLGVVMTQAALDEFAMQKGFGKTTKAMSEQEKVALRLAFVQDKLSGAAGDFVRTSDGWANQTRVLSLRFESLKASIGQGLISALTPVIRLLNTIVEKLQVAADAFRDFMGELFGSSGGESTGAAISAAGDAISAGMADGAVSAAKIKKSLAGFDEINVISSGSDTSGSGGGSGTDVSTGSGVGSVAEDADKASGMAGKLNKFLDDIKKKLKIIGKETGIITLFEKILKSAGNLKTGFTNAFDSLRNAINNNAPNLEAFKTSMEQAFTTVSQTITTIWGDTWLACSEHFASFTEENGPAIEEFITNAIGAFSRLGEAVSGTYDDIFGSLLSWWESDGKRIYDEILTCIDDIIKWVLDLWNNCLWPFVDNMIKEGQRLWDEHLKPLWDKILGFLTSVWDFLYMLWEKLLKPVVDFIIEQVGPPISDVLTNVGKVFSDVFGTIADVVGGILDCFGGLLDFITGVFTGDWNKAWEGIKKFFTGIWDAIWGVVKGVINLIIDALNALWSGLYAALRLIVNGVGDLVSAIGSILGQDWGWEIPEHAPQIPRLATGGYVAANTPQLAVIGDNKHEGEIVAPESKIAEAVAAGMSMVLSKLQQSHTRATESGQPIIIKIGEEDFWSGFIDYHNSIVKRTGDTPLLV